MTCLIFREPFAKLFVGQLEAASHLEKDPLLIYQKPEKHLVKHTACYLGPRPRNGSPLGQYLLKLDMSLKDSEPTATLMNTCSKIWQCVEEMTVISLVRQQQKQRLPCRPMR